MNLAPFSFGLSLLYDMSLKVVNKKFTFFNTPEKIRF